MTSQRIVKIGCTMPTSGFEARHATTQLLAVKLALEEFQQRTPTTAFSIELVVEDDQVNPEKAAAIARAFAADPDIVAVVGPMNSDTNLAAGPIFAEAGLPHIATAASNRTLSQQGWKTFFRVVANDIHHYRDAAKYAVHVLGATSIAVVNDGSNFTRPMAEGFRDTALQLGASIPAFVGVERGRTDYSEAIRQLGKHPFDLIFFVVIEPVAVVIARQLREAGVMVPFFATDGLKPLPYFATFGYEVDGPYYTNVCADPDIKPEAGRMVERYKARFGSEPTVYVCEAYDAAAIILTAVGGLPGPRIGRADVLSALAGIRDYPGTSGLISFDKNGDILHPEIGIYKLQDRQLRFLGFTKDLLPATTSVG
jgi:branched-chain amino acid transport system substrate-binding protein